MSRSSGKTSNESKKKYNKKTYLSHLYMVRINSELGQAITEFKKIKGTSLNYVITKQLCNFFDVPFPHPEKDIDI